MTVVRVMSLEGALDAELRRRLGEELTSAVLEVETGKDTPEARPGVMVLFDELRPGSWFHGGTPVEERYSGAGILWASVAVMQGPWTEELKGELSSRLSGVLANVSAGEDPRAVWVTVHEVPDGAWSVNGNVVRIEQLLWAFQPDRQATIRALLESQRGGGVL